MFGDPQSVHLCVCLLQHQSNSSRVVRKPDDTRVHGSTPNIRCIMRNSSGHPLRQWLNFPGSQELDGRNQDTDVIQIRSPIDIALGNYSRHTMALHPTSNATLWRTQGSCCSLHENTTEEVDRTSPSEVLGAGHNIK